MSLRYWWRRARAGSRAEARRAGKLGGSPRYQQQKKAHTQDGQGLDRCNAGQSVNEIPHVDVVTIFYYSDAAERAAGPSVRREDLLMMKMLYFVAALIAIAFLADALNRRQIRRLRQSGLYPPPGQGSDAHVERLILLGRKMAAIKLYREVHGVDLKAAKEAVDELGRQLKVSGALR